MPSKTVMTSGASGGVGRATAQRFAREGWNIGVLARQNEALEKAVLEVKELGAIPLK